MDTVKFNELLKDLNGPPEAGVLSPDLPDGLPDPEAMIAEGYYPQFAMPRSQAPTKATQEPLFI
jgi:hypothetical protein